MAAVTTIRLEDDQLTLRDVAAMVGDGPILVTHQGEPVMAVVGLDKDEAEPGCWGRILSWWHWSRRRAGRCGPEKAIRLMICAVS